MSEAGVEHHRNGDYPKEDSMIRVSRSSMPPNWRGTIQEIFILNDFEALRHAGPRAVVGVGDVPAIVVHMIATQR